MLLLLFSTWQPSHQLSTNPHLLWYRWPGCSAAHYGDDWHLLFRRRAALPAALVRDADRCHEITARAANGALRLNSSIVYGASGTGGSSVGGGPGSPSKVNVYGFSSAPHCNMVGLLLEQSMQAAFNIGLALATNSAAGYGRKLFAAADAAAEVVRFKQDISWWLANKSEVCLLI